MSASAIQPAACAAHSPHISLSDDIVEAMAIALWQRSSGKIEVREPVDGRLQRWSPKQRAKTVFNALPGYVQDDLRDVCRGLLSVAVGMIDPMTNPATQLERVARLHVELADVGDTAS